MDGKEVCVLGMLPWDDKGDLEYMYVCINSVFDSTFARAWVLCEGDIDVFCWEVFS
jgi:hypothetical protein